MFNIMKKTTLSTLAAIALVGAVSAPVMAQSSFNQRVPAVRQDNNNDQLVGGAIGAVLGGVIGSEVAGRGNRCLLYTSPSPRDRTRSRMPSSA